MYQNAPHCRSSGRGWPVRLAPSDFWRSLGGGGAEPHRTAIVVTDGAAVGSLPQTARHERRRAMSVPPRLSVGLPVYNGEKYLAEAIDALLGQSYTDFELIISDNASSDGTADICRHYEVLDHRVRYFRQPHNIGLAPNHNFVAEQARGSLFKWAANDDLYARDLLKRCVDALEENPHVVLAHCWTAKVDPQRKCHGGDRVPAEHSLPAGTGAVPEHLVRQWRRRRLRRHQDRHPPAGGEERQLSSRGPDDHRRDRPARALLPGA